VNTRLARNAESRAKAEHDREPWGCDELEWLQTWDGSEEYLAELAELLGRTIEACRQQFYVRRQRGCWTATMTTTTTTTTYRGWMASDGDGWT
jgi:hypothetical protein